MAITMIMACLLNTLKIVNSLSGVATILYNQNDPASIGTTAIMYVKKYTGGNTHMYAQLSTHDIAT